MRTFCFLVLIDVVRRGSKRPKVAKGDRQFMRCSGDSVLIEVSLSQVQAVSTGHRYSIPSVVPLESSGHLDFTDPNRV